MILIMSEQELKKYRLTGVDEPTDEQSEVSEEPHEEQREIPEAPAANSDFTSANASNIWNSIPSTDDDDDSDIPAILRRRRKNRD